MHKLTLDVPVNDVPAAVRFYCQALNGTLLDEPDVSNVYRVNIGRWTLRVVDEAGYVPDASSQRFYTKGRTPRLELRVDDVTARVAQALAAGATLFSRSPANDQIGPIRHAHLIDPFGHLWVFARADNDESPVVPIR